MTEKRKEELLTKVLRGFAECSDGVETYRLLHDDFGITNEELVECGMDRLRKHFQYEWAEGTPQREYHLLHPQRTGTAAGRTGINDVRKVGNYG